ncbi:MAG: bifunctional UDP-N-acetylglucosamine diphosphorylase/glucosamine-1-phosphate N-acetyltransferase GlmU [Dehalococcoidia bacterium]
MESWGAVILAAGKGTRMRSRIPKVLHPVCGRPMLAHMLDIVRKVGIGSVTVVVPPEHTAVAQASGGGVQFVVQPEPLGTGHALACARPALEGRFVHILSLYGDVPLLLPQTLQRLIAHHEAAEAAITVLTATEAPVPGLGRIIRDTNTGRLLRIVEEKEASPQELQVREVNSGIYALNAALCFPLLERLPRHPNGEFFLTDLAGLAIAQGMRVEAVSTDDPLEILGVNDREALARAEVAMRQRLCRRWLQAGVSILDPATTYLDASVEIGQDTVIYPGTHLRGATRIGRDCRIGPYAVLQDTVVGDGCVVVASFLEGAILEEGVDVGPFSHLRPGSYLERGVHIGNFVEVKNSRLGQGVKSGHFSYLGDATIGPEANIGAGTITCNFDGVRKHPTRIGARAFIGSDTLLVAPVAVGDGAATGAGSVVNKDVPPGTLVVGMPARPIRRVEAQEGGLQGQEGRE